MKLIIRPQDNFRLSKLKLLFPCGANEYLASSENKSRVWIAWMIKHWSLQINAASNSSIDQIWISFFNGKAVGLDNFGKISSNFFQPLPLPSSCKGCLGKQNVYEIVDNLEGIDRFEGIEISEKLIFASFRLHLFDFANETSLGIVVNNGRIFFKRC